MKRRFATALGVVACLTAGLVGLAVLRAANVITLTPLPASDYPGPIGIDWLSTSNRLLISTNYDTGLPHNFETVDRGTGAHVQWGATSGWQNEIYFATVRPGQPGDWVVGDVLSAKGQDTGHIALFDSSGNPVNLNFATLAGEVKLKRGGMTFDRYGVPGLDGALLVLASNASNVEGGGSTLWKVNSSGIAQKIIDNIDIPDHGEGIVVVPNDSAYGPWAGKILVGKEESSQIDVIDPLTGTHVVSNVPVPIEDIWVIPANADFYGVDYPGTKIWTTPASDWANAGLVGKVLFAREQPAQLWVASWNGSSFVFTDITVPGPTSWEHITFVPAGTPGLTIKKYTNGADANDPNAPGVPNIAPGGTVTWTYEVTNTGQTSVPRAQVSVTDNTTGVTPTFTSELSGNGDTIFDHGEVWRYTATGTALDLTLPPPAGVHTVANSCTAGGSQPPRTAYTNVGTGTIPGASATDPSSYCNPPPVPNLTIVKLTNGLDANDPNASGVPNIPAGGTVTWTYRVTNTGQTSVPRAQVSVTDNTTGVTPTFTSEQSGNGDTIFNPGEVWLYTATGTALDLTLPPPAGVQTVANSCTAGGTQPPRTAYTNVGTAAIPGASATDPSSYCNPPPQTGKSISIGPSSMEGAIRIDAGDWVNGGYGFKTNFTGNITIAATVSITGKCIGGTLLSDTLTVNLGSVAYSAVAGSDWKPTGDANSILSWQGSVVAPATLCGGGGGQLDASKGAVFNATISGAPAGGLVTFRFKFRDPAAKGKPNTNCLDASDPNRNRADVCGASWSATKMNP